MANGGVPPIPLKTPTVGSNGYLTQPWAQWFQLLFSLIGDGSPASSNTTGSSATSLSTTLENITINIDGINQGRNL